LNNEIVINHSSSIDLYADMLNDQTKNKDFKTISTTGNNESNLIQSNYTRTLAHELMHIYYRTKNNIAAAKWGLWRDYAEKHNLPLCDDFSDNSYNCDHCSKGKGHEKNNPENFQCCSTECNY
jgi:hypothetical protein